MLLPVATIVDYGALRAKLGVRMQGIKGTFGSKRSVFCLVMVGIATSFVYTGHLSGDSWVDFAKWITTALVISHTVTSRRPGQAADPTAAPTTPAA